MTTLIHADIFFFITSIAVVILGIVLCIIGVYAIFIMRDAKYISAKIRHAADELEGDFENLRRQISGEGRKAKYLVDFFLGKLTKKR